jgi:hypothetical protein
MKDTEMDRDDEIVDAAWRKFAEHDQAIVPPAQLERRTVAAWQASQRSWRSGHLPRRPVVLWSVAALAAAVLVAVVVDRGRNAPAPPAPDRAARPLATTHERRTSTLPPAMITLAADPIQETETLHLVRVRVPQSALRAVGIMVAGPDSGGLVEVDVLVGEDGLPRDVRRVRTIQE